VFFGSVVFMALTVLLALAGDWRARRGARTARAEVSAA
jgi:hypothetical protein